MKNRVLISMIVLLMIVLAACNNTENGAEEETDELKMLEVEFIVPEKADVGETVELKAIVTYGDEKVTDADDVNFEYWEQGKEEESTKIDANNNEDGTYTVEVAFEKDGIFEMYAHTTARGLHPMPKKSITVGEGASTEPEEDHHDDGDGHEHSDHEEGFGMHFVKPEEVKMNDEVNLMVHLQMDGEPLENARVRYEIFTDSSDKHDWIEAEETASGEYVKSYAFDTEEIYTIVIHVEDDEDLHEHAEHQIEVTR